MQRIDHSTDVVITIKHAIALVKKQPELHMNEVPDMPQIDENGWSNFLCFLMLRSRERALDFAIFEFSATKFSESGGQHAMNVD